jgi:hypothetical protein
MEIIKGKIINYEDPNYYINVFMKSFFLTEDSVLMTDRYLVEISDMKKHIIEIYPEIGIYVYDNYNYIIKNFNTFDCIVSSIKQTLYKNIFYFN